MWNKSIIKIVNSSDDKIYDRNYFDDSFYITSDNKLVLKDKLGFAEHVKNKW